MVAPVLATPLLLLSVMPPAPRVKVTVPAVLAPVMVYLPLPDVPKVPKVIPLALLLSSMATENTEPAAAAPPAPNTASLPAGTPLHANGPPDPAQLVVAVAQVPEPSVIPP